VTTYLPLQELAEVIEKGLEKALQRLNQKENGNNLAGDILALRAEMGSSMRTLQTQLTQQLNDAITKVQAEAEKRAEVML
jgi:hypothetical protein